MSADSRILRRIIGCGTPMPLPQRVPSPFAFSAMPAEFAPWRPTWPASVCMTIVGFPGCVLLGLPPEGGADARGAAPEFSFSRDTFAFANLIRARHPDGDDLYANYCFVLARGLRQFKQFARFDPTLPRLDHAGYVALVRPVA